MGKFVTAAASSISYWRTTVPGVGLLLIAAGHYWQTGALDWSAVIAGLGLTATEK